MATVIQATNFAFDHPFDPDDPTADNPECMYITGMDMNPASYVHCGLPLALHRHGWHGRAAEGGSNTVCSVAGCGRNRLDEVHHGEEPVFFTKAPVRSSLREEAFAAISASVGKPEPSFEDLIPAVQAWDAFAAEVRKTIIVKSRGYGDAWEHQGWLGNLARILSKASRLKSMLWREKPWLGTGGDESAEEQEHVRETAVDMAALCAFLAANVEAENRWGK